MSKENMSLGCITINQDLFIRPSQLLKRYYTHSYTNSDGVSSIYKNYY